MKKVFFALLFVCVAFSSCENNDTSITEDDQLIFDQIEAVVTEQDERQEDKEDTSNPNNPGACEDPTDPTCE